MIAAKNPEVDKRRPDTRGQTRGDEVIYVI